MAIGCFLIVACVLCFHKEEVAAAVFDDAYSYYTLYGNQVVFKPTTQTDGNLYYATSAKTTNVGIRYRTIGWKISVQDKEGNSVQNIFFRLGGSAMSRISEIYRDNTVYDLYCISLHTLKQSMNPYAKELLSTGNCQIKLNACMVVVKNGVAKGGMNEFGNFWGDVYTTYQGIAGAQNWSNASKQLLKSYFDKEVNGLFYTVSVSKGNGIAAVFGGGRYCYGTYATITAIPENGYAFSFWAGRETVYAKEYSFFVNSSTTWVAKAKPIDVTVTFYRNNNKADTTSTTHAYTFGVLNQNFFNPKWEREGYQMIGWSHEKNATAPTYSVTATVTDSWICRYAKATSLYAVWEPNTYTIEFDGNGADIGKMEPIRSNYSKEITIPACTFSYSNKNTSFLGWSIQKASTEPDINSGEKVSVSSLANLAKVTNTNNGHIKLYAIWDDAPMIDADDLYYSLEDAQKGIITELELASHIKAVDVSDGEIVYGVHKDNSFLLTNYQEEDFTGFTDSGSVTQTCVAIDSVGNYTERVITVHIVNTKSVPAKDVFGECRFISLKYFKDDGGTLLPNESGGLLPNSVWRLEKSFMEVLDSALRAMK